MKTIISLLLATLFVLPVALAGTEGTPDVTDTTGDAPAPLDVVSAWFATVGATRATGPDQSVTLTIKLRDLGVAAPVADDNLEDTRYYYQVSLTPSSTGTPITVTCYVSQADTSVAGLGAVGGDMGVGTQCGVPRDMFARDMIKASPKVDILSSTLTITFSRPAATESPNAIPLPAGTALEGVVIRTSSGSLASTAASLFTPGSNRGPTLDTTDPVSYVI